MTKYLPFIVLTLLISGCATRTEPQSVPQVITKIVKQDTAPAEKKDMTMVVKMPWKRSFYHPKIE